MSEKPAPSHEVTHTPDSSAPINTALADALAKFKPLEKSAEPAVPVEVPEAKAAAKKSSESVDVPKTPFKIGQEILIQYDADTKLEWKICGFNIETQKALVFGADTNNEWGIRLVPATEISELNPGLVMPDVLETTPNYHKVRYGSEKFDYKVLFLWPNDGMVMIGGVDNNGENPHVLGVSYEDLLKLNPELDIPQMRTSDIKPESEEKTPKVFVPLADLESVKSLNELIGILENNLGIKDGKARMSSANLLPKIRLVQGGLEKITTLPLNLRGIVQSLLTESEPKSDVKTETPVDELGLGDGVDALDVAKKPIDFMPSESKEEPAIADKTPEILPELTPEQNELLIKAAATPGFDEFLANHPDTAFEATKPLQIIELFQAFQVREKVVTMSGQVAAETFKDEIGLGDIDVRDSLRAYYDRLIYEDPGKIIRQAEVVAQAEKLNQEIAAAEAALKQKISELPAGSLMNPEEIEARRKIANQTRFFGPAEEKAREALQTTAKMLEKGQEWRAAIKLCAFDMPYAMLQYTLTAFGYNSGERYKARQAIEAVHGDSSYESIDAYKKTTQENKALSGKTAEVETRKAVAQEVYAQRRKELAEQFLSSEKAIVAAREKIIDEMKKMLKSSTTMPSLMEVQKLLDRNVNVKMGAMPKYMTPKSVEAFQKAIDEKARRIIDTHIEQTLTTPPKTKGATVGAELDKTVEYYLNMDKIGSLEKKEIKRVLREALKIIMEKKDVNKLMKIRIGMLLLTNKLK